MRSEEKGRRKRKSVGSKAIFTGLTQTISIETLK